MILNSLDKQLTLDENGAISWQRDLTNPMAGEVVAEVKKGETILTPSISLVDCAATKDEDQAALAKFISEWLARYIAEALQPLTNLKADDIPVGAPQEIANKIYDALGVIPRADLQSLIAQMDEEQRASLRTKKIRFGPLLVYLPELNKPAAVRLRALLLTLFNDKDLPAAVPADGIVSFSVEGKELDKSYYQSIGYPIYGPRSVRVDMLDRVICAVYDSAKDGKFQAQHQMAEWLGSNIADLYAVLESMGHTKIHDPADEAAKAEEVKDVKPEGDKAEETKVEIPKDEAVLPSGDTVVAKPVFEKPQLATFALKKGKAMDRGSAGDVSSAKPRDNKFSNSNFKSDKKKFKPKGKPHNKNREPKQNVYVAEAKNNPEDSPFAILQQLKTADKDK